MDRQTDEAPHGLTQSIDQIVSAEEDALRRRTRGEASVEAFVKFVGTLPFVLIHVAFLAAWVMINTRVVTAVPAFDPPPFNLLAMIVSFEGVVLTSLVLMTQRRTNAQADRRDHLHLQVNLLTERETTQILQLLHRIGDRMDIPHNETEEARQLAKPTSVAAMVEALHERHPADEK